MASRAASGPRGVLWRPLVYTNHGRPQKFFQGGINVENLAYAFQVADDAMQIDVHKTFYSFYPISLC